MPLMKKLVITSILISRALAASLVATIPFLSPGTLGIAPGGFGSHPESVCRPAIDLPSDWQILSLLIRANTGSGP